MNKKKGLAKKDIIVIGVASLIAIFLLVFTLVTKKEAETAYIKYKNKELFSVNLTSGKYTKKTDEYLEDIKPVIDGDNLMIGDFQDNRIDKGQGVIVYLEDNFTHFYIMGYRGYIHIEYSKERKQIRVVEEDSPYHICSNLGFSNSKPIICLPNLVTIVFDNDVDITIWKDKYENYEY